MPGLHFNITADNSNFMRRLEETRNGVQRTSKQIEQSGMSIEDMFKRISTAAASIGVALSAQQLVKQVAMVRGEFQQLEVAFTTMLGSAEKADALMSQLVKTAAVTPFGLQDVAGGAKQLLAYGMEAEKVNETLVRLGDISAGLGLSLGDMVYLYGTTMAQGRLMAADLAQFTGRGIPMIGELAKQFGVAESEVKDLVSAGKVGFPEVQKVIESLTNEGGKFGGLMKAQSKTITGQISNIEDAISTMFNDIGKQSEGAINASLGAISKLVENYETVGKVLLELVGTYGAYRVALMATTALQALQTAGIGALTAKEAIHYGWLVLQEKAQKALNASTLANPYVAAAAAIAALGYGIYKLATYTTDAEKAQEKLNDAAHEAEKAAMSEQVELARLKGELEATTKGSEEYNTIKDKIVKNFGKYYDGLDAEIEKVGLTEAAYHKLTEAITASFAARQYEKFAKEQSAEYENTLSEELTKIQDRLYDKLGDERGAKVYTQLRNGILSGKISFDGYKNGAHQLTGITKEMKAALDEAAEVDGVWFGIMNRSIEGSVRKITNAKKILDDTDKKARERFGIGEEKKEEEAKKEVIKNKKYWEDYKKEQQGLLDAMDDAELQGEKAQQLRKNIAEAQAKLEARNVSKVGKRKDKEKEDKKKAKDETKAAEELLSLTRKNQQAYIDTLDEGTDKKLKQIELDYQREKDTIAKQRKDWEKEGDGNLSKEQTDALSNAEKYASDKRIKQIEEVNKAEEQARNRYLVNYGSYQQKKDALTKEYEEKKKSATTQGDKDILDKELQDALSAIDMDKLKDEINWEMVFGDLSKASKESLDGVKAQLKSFKESDEYKNMSVEQKKVIDEALNNIQSSLIDKGGLLGDLPNQLEELAKAQDEVTKAQNEYEEALKSGTEEQQEAAKKKLNVAEQKEQNQQTNVKKSSDKAVDNILAVTDAITQLGTASEMSLSQIGGIAEMLINTFSEAGSKIGGIVGAIFSVLGAVSEQGIVGFIGNIFNSIGGAIGGLLGFKMGNEEETKERTDKLVDSNGHLADVIEKATDNMEKYNGEKSIEAYKEAIEAQKTANKNYKDILDNQQHYWKRGSHSNAHKFNMSDQDVRDIENLLEIDLANGRWDSFKDLSAEQMAMIREQRLDIWNRMKEQGDYDQGKYFEDYADQAGKIEELTEKISDNLLGTSFESMRDNFVDSLMDMEQSAEDFTKDFEQMMNKALLRIAIGNTLDADIEAWHKKWGERLKDGVSDGEMDDVYEQAKEDWDKIVQEGLNKRDELFAMTGYTGDSGETSQQGGTTRGFEAMSQDTASELNGRFTALQMSGEEIKNQMATAVTMIGGVSAVCTIGNETLSNILNQQVIANSYLEDIKIDTRKIYTEFNEGIKKIVQQTKHL